jgi:hypothetical protein
MLVYGDHSEFAASAERLERIADQLAAISGMPPGIDRHAKLVGTLIEAGQLLQGVADAGGSTDELDSFVYALARAVVRSFDSAFEEIGGLPPVPPVRLSEEVELRLPEGFAFYAVYPEAYIVAARKLRLVGRPRVIGIRSIGTTLAALVAAALDAPTPLTVRPFGDPFARQVDLPRELIEADAHYLIVDEGPGLSGSSFGAVADWLEDRGVPLERIALLPSHSGDIGTQGSVRHRHRWSRAQRVAAELDTGFLIERFGPLEAFATGGAWERLKIIGTQEGKRVLLKFAGLGAIGERKLAMARALHAAGFTAKPVGLVHGFLVERWCGDAAPLQPGEKPVEEIAAYVGARARLFPANGKEGASLERLLEMCRRNLSLALGEEAASAVAMWRPKLEALARRVVRVRTDNKLDSGEWLRLPGGRLLKTDALDHHCAHDLIGCQDVAWDVAGAIVEFDLTEPECARLVRATERSAGRHVDPELLSFCRLAYCCFRLGRASLADEREEVDRYAAAAHAQLHQHVCRGTRQDSLVG